MSEAKILDLDNTKRTCFSNCPRLYYWQHVLNLRPRRGSTALRYGVTWHAMMEYMYNDIKANGWRDLLTILPAAFKVASETWQKETEGFDYVDDYRSLDRLQESFYAYINTFTNDPTMLKVISAEKVFEILIEPENKEEEFLFKFYDAEPFYFTGKIDLQVELNGPNWIFEHKTTGQYMSLAVQRLNRSAQQMGYVYAAKKLGIDIEGLLVSIHHISARKSKSGEWGPPKIEFQRVPQIFSQADLDDWRQSFLHTAVQVQAARRSEWWPMCLDSCYQYGGCAYSILCEQNNKPLEDRNFSNFIEKAWDVRTENASE